MVFHQGSSYKYAYESAINWIRSWAVDLFYNIEEQKNKIIQNHYIPIKNRLGMLLNTVRIFIPDSVWVDDYNLNYFSQKLSGT